MQGLPKSAASAVLGMKGECMRIGIAGLGRLGSAIAERVSLRLLSLIMDDSGRDSPRAG